MNRPRALLIFAIALGLQQYSFAQEQSGIVGFAKEFAQDQRGLWTSPLRVDRQDMKWLLPLSMGAATLLRADRSVSSEVQETNSLRTPSRFISQAGTYPVFATPLAMMVLGRLSHSERTTQAGTVGLQAALQSTLIVQVLKASTNRERPDKNHGSGGFWDGGKSFPSGHAMATWALASAMADQYSDKKWIGITGYSVATAVSLSRIGGLNHFPSDVLVGSSVGWLVGHYVSRHHKH
ncbi:MAG TPA: phosphatase PAP2 family protein [Terriglobia bacterium]|nr:phosphatase PAP2 family protein [Terriglobia bacterium]